MVVPPRAGCAAPRPARPRLQDTSAIGLIVTAHTQLQPTPEPATRVASSGVTGRHRKTWSRADGKVKAIRPVPQGTV